jgi:predicted Rossmann-fold nucleotide-binding protein
MHAKPIVVVDPGGVFAQLRAQVDSLVNGGFVRAPAREAVQWAATAAEALDLVEAGLRGDAEDRTVVPTAEDLMESEP